MRVGVGERLGGPEVLKLTEQVALPASRVVPVPDRVSLQAAAAAILQGMTAHYLVTSTFSVREGDVAVVHAAAGGVGLLLTQLVKRRGGIVVATTSSASSAFSPL